MRPLSTFLAACKGPPNAWGMDRIKRTAQGKTDAFTKRQQDGTFYMYNSSLAAFSFSLQEDAFT